MNNSNNKLILLDQGLVSASNFLTNIILARYLGLESYGFFILIYGLLLFISGIHISIILSPIMVYLPLHTKSNLRDSYLSAIFQLQILFILLLALASFALYILGYYLVSNVFFLSIQIPLTITILSFILQDYFRRLFLILESPSKALFNDSICYGLQIILIVVFAKYNLLSLSSALYIIGLTSLSACVIGYFQIARLTPLNIHKFSKLKIHIADHWVYGKWLIGKNLAYWSSSQLLIYLSALLISVKAVGAIGATRNIIGAVNIIFQSIDNVLTSRAANLYEKNGIESATQYLKKISLLGGLSTLFIVLAVSAWAEELLFIAYQGKYTEFYWMIYWWALFFFIGFFHRPLSSGLNILRKNRDIFISMLFGILTIPIICIPIILYYHLTGFMIAICTIQITIMISLAIFYKRGMANYRDSYTQPN